MLKKYTTYLGLGLICFVLMVAELNVFSQEAVSDRELYALSAVLMDGDSGRILYGKNAGQFMANASTTKIMTCIVALENSDMDEMVSVSDYATSMPKVKLYLKKGESYRMGDLIYSLMLESHNDSAVAIAEHIGRKLLSDTISDKQNSEFTIEESKQAVDAFMTLMNEKALEIGCRNTTFLTPNGLDAEKQIQRNGEYITIKHGTCASDLALIMRYCVAVSPMRDKFLEITRTDSYGFSGAGGRYFQLTNHNLLLRTMEGAISGKTGFTNEAGYCYVGAIQKEDKFLIVALLACGWPNHKNYKWCDTGKLVEYGMNQYEFHSFDEIGIDTVPMREIYVMGGRVEKGQKFCTIPLRIETNQEWNTENTGMGRIKQGILLKEDDKVVVNCIVRNQLKAPVRAGEKVGEINYLVDGIVYKKEDIVTAAGVKSADLKWCFINILESFLIG